MRRRLFRLVVFTALLAGAVWVARRLARPKESKAPVAPPWPPLPDDHDQPAPAGAPTTEWPAHPFEVPDPVTAEIPAVRVAPPTPAQRRRPRKSSGE